MDTPRLEELLRCEWQLRHRATNNYIVIRMSVPISLELAKTHLRIGDDTSLDTLIEQYLEMAFAIAEDYTNRKLTEGYSEENLPASIRAAILLTLGTLFDNEADIVVGRSVAQLPLTAEKLLQPWRVHPYSNEEDV